jgi:hypothetical protein
LCYRYNVHNNAGATAAAPADTPTDAGTDSGTDAGSSTSSDTPFWKTTLGAVVIGLAVALTLVALLLLVGFCLLCYNMKKSVLTLKSYSFR